MSEMFDYAAYLSHEIGARPAGTEEERQAAFYVAETLQRKAGLQSQVEDFTCAVDYDLPRAILCGISIVLTILSIIFPILVVPAFIVTLVTGALYCVEVLFRPVIARAISHGASQNVVARYEPNEYTESTSQRHRKIILLSHYDTGKVQPELSPAIISALPIIHWAELGGMVLLPLLLLIRLIFIPTAVFGIVITVLSVIAMVLALLPVLLLFLRRTAPYNEGANCNASGVAVLMEVAARVRNGRAKALAAEAEVVPTGVRIHGAAAARANGLVPDGAELVYEAAETDEDASPEDRLMAAKAAVAMLTGKPVSASVNIDLGEETVEEAEPGLTEADIAAQNAAYVANALEGVELPVAAPAAAPATQAFDESATFAGENSTDQAPVTFMRNGAQAAAAAAEAGIAETGAAAPTVAFTEEEKSSVPDWFTAARAKAKQNVGDDEEEAAPIQRSRYAQAMEMAQREIDARIEAERAEAEAQTTPNDTEARLEEMRASIIANYPTSAEAAAAAAKKAAEEGTEDQANIENPTTAFAPVKIDGEQLKQEAAAQAESSKQVVVQGEVSAPSAEATGELPISRPLSASIPLPVPEAAQAPAVDAAKLQSLIPQLNVNKTKPSEEQQARQSALRQVLPSLSGSIKLPDPMQDPADDAADEPAVDSPSESFSPVTATAVFSTIDEDDYEVMDEEYADDVDESHYEAAAPSETGYVEMPKSRAGRLFGKFRRNKKNTQRETSAQEWLDVDEDFDARKVGAERGGWESFREDYEEDVFDDSDDGYDDFEESGFRPRGWNGGAFSLKSLGNVASRFKKGGAPEADVMVDEEIDYVPGDGDPYEYGEVYEEALEPASEEPAPKKSRFGFGRNKDAAEPARATRRSRMSSDFTDGFSSDLGSVQSDQQAIRNFHEPNIEVEVWFVALGAELAGNGGIDAFIAEHRDELKGAIFIDVEALGAGELMLVEEEGMYFPVKASSRMDRYSRKAAAACGMHIDRAKMLWRNSAAAAVLRNGSQAMHLVGMKDGKPAYFAQRNDTMTNIDEETLERNADFLVELLRSI